MHGPDSINFSCMTLKCWFSALAEGLVHFNKLLSEFRLSWFDFAASLRHVNMASTVQPLGLTVLQNPDYAEVDIVFVHGLQGHPGNTWTWSNQSRKPLDADLVAGSHLTVRLKNAFGPKRRDVSKGPSPSPSQREHGGDDVFWPRDLLGHHGSCKRARVMTYGYDTNILSLVDTCNFTTLSAHGETLLNRVAAKRSDHMYRPLMFITHSLGGLVVKSVCVSD